MTASPWECVDHDVMVGVYRGSTVVMQAKRKINHTHKGDSIQYLLIKDGTITKCEALLQIRFCGLPISRGASAGGCISGCVSRRCVQQQFTLYCKIQELLHDMLVSTTTGIFTWGGVYMGDYVKHTSV